MLKRFSFITSLLLFVLFITACPNGLNLPIPTGGDSSTTNSEVWHIIKSGTTDIPKGNITLTLNSDGTGSQALKGLTASSFNYSISGNIFTVSNMAAAFTYIHNGTYTMTKTDSTLKLVPLSVSEEKAETIEAVK